MGLGVRELFDNNIKVHFAGSDGGEIFYAALLAAQTKYRLFSCYKYILKCRPDDDFRLPADHVIRVQDTVNRHVIQDSGLFTLMFGAGKGQTQTLESLTEWQDKLIAFVQQNNLRCTCVELDCQKVLGVREAWYFRERMKKLLNNPQINVFHFEDGMRGLDSMIDFSDYIALSIPELRIIKPKTFREDTRYLTHYIKNRKPEIDIHLLGSAILSTQGRMISLHWAWRWLMWARHRTAQRFLWTKPPGGSALMCRFGIPALMSAKPRPSKKSKFKERTELDERYSGFYRA